MRICIPTVDDGGPEAIPSDHFGSAPYFTFFDSDAGQWEVVRNGAGTGVHGACRPLDFLRERPVHAVLCRGLGRRALERLKSWGARVCVTAEPRAGGSVEAFLAGRLDEISEADACAGQGHHHHPDPGQGRGRTWGRGFGRPPLA
jgi:predicted Fe-Mo cluster-binding NifX family protein